MKNTIAVLISVVIIGIVALLSLAATQTINTVPSANSTFITDLQTFLEDESANRDTLKYGGAVVSGGTASTDASLTHTISGVSAFVNGYYVSQAAVSHTYTATRRTYVYLRDDDSRTVTITNATVTYDTHFVFGEMAASSSKPTTPTGCLLLFFADTGAASIDAVVDLRILFDVTLWSNASSELTINSGGTVYPTHQIHTIDTASDAATDNLDFLSTNTIPDGGVVIISPENASRTVVVRHNQSGDGEIFLLDDASYSMYTTDDYLILVRRGSDWYELSRNRQSLISLPIKRPKFSHVDDDSITFTSGAYPHYGTDYQLVYWTSGVTVDIVGASGNTTYYLYIDDSAIVTAATCVLTSSEFMWSATEPTWSDAKYGYYNGSDLAIFAANTDGDGDFCEFQHDGGDKIFLSQSIQGGIGSKFGQDYLQVDLDATWDDVYLAMPSFSTRAQVTTLGEYSDNTPTLYWRTNGATSTGNNTLFAASGVTYVYNTLEIMTDSLQIFEIKYNANGNDTASVWLNGWHLPNGM